MLFVSLEGVHQGILVSFKVFKKKFCYFLAVRVSFRITLEELITIKTLSMLFKEAFFRS